MKLEEVYIQPIEKVFPLVESSEKGLAPKEAELRLIRYGPNVLFEEQRFKTLRLLASQFRNFFVVLLFIAAALSFVFESVVNGLVLLAVIILNVGVSFFQERKAERTLEALRKIHPPHVEVIRGEKTIEVSSEELVVGDVVILREGAAVPADLRLFEVRDLKIDEAVLTGESIPSEKVTEKFPRATSLADRENMAYTGTLVVSGTGNGVVVQTGLETEFGRIATFVREQEERSLLLERIAHLGVWLTGFAAFLSLLIFAFGFLRGHEFIHMFNFAIANFVSAVPESLPTITTLSLAATALRLSRRKALVRHLPTVESLSGINLFAFDKTGTLTLNEMMVARVVFPNQELKVTGTGFSSEGKIYHKDDPIDIKSDPQLMKFIEVGVLGGAASISPVEGREKQWQVHGDPTEGAFLILAKKAGLEFEKKEAIKEFAFTSERKMRTRVVFKDKELQIYSMGAPEVVLPLCRYYQLNGKRVDLSPARRVQIESKATELAINGYRVVALAAKEKKAGAVASREVEKELTFVGFAGLIDKPKEKVDETFATLMEAGIKPVIITGDHPRTALAVARESGLRLTEQNILSGVELDKLSDDELLEVIPKTILYARITPTQKYRLVEAFKKLGLRVAVSGDGVNDAPALKKADVGVVMGERGTDVSKEAADLVILDDKVETVLPAIIEARTLYDNIKKFFTFLLSGNFDELLIISGAFLMGLPQPLTILQVLWINLITDSFPAFALTYDPPSGDVLKEGPRDLGAKMIHAILPRALFYGFLDLIVDVFIFLYYLPDVAKARTALFTQIVLFEVLIIFSLRTEGPFWKEFGKNRYLLAACSLSIIFQLLLIYVPSIREIMGVTPLNLFDWGLIIGLVFITFLIAEVVKGVRSLWMQKAKAKRS